MITQWNWEPFDENEQALGRELSQKLRLHPVVGSLLIRRGISTEEEARRFFLPQLQELYDPFLMKDMDKAVARLNKAVGSKENILVYGDYDVDGTTAVALVYKILRSAGCSEAQLFYYIPDRNDDGYGVSIQGVDYAAERDVKLVIVLDCGIKALKEIDYAKEKGIDFIICDHHTPEEVLPNAVAVLNPKREDNTYPFTELSGCGIGFKLMQGFALNNNIRLNNVLDLCAVSIAGDVVSVTDENRILAYHGLRQINHRPSPGLEGIIKSCGLSSTKIDMSDIVFKLGPILNASGRMRSGMQTVDLLLSGDVEEAEEKCRNIIRDNERRRKLDKIITSEAQAMIESQKLHEQNKLIVLYGSKWHKGVIGIVSSRIAEQFSRSVIILSGEGNSVSGSGRSVGGFDIYTALDKHKELLLNFGGHPYAAGLTLSQDKVSIFIDRIVRYANEIIAEERFVPEINIDAELRMMQVNRKLFESVQQMSPFGPDNPKPIFMTRRLYDIGSSRTVGKLSGHLKLDVTDAINRRYPISAIAFGQAVHEGYIKSQRPFAICYTLKEQIYNGVASLQMLVKEIKHEDEPIELGRSR